MATLPLDNFGHPIPALGYLDGGARTLAITSASTRTTTPFNADTSVISVFASVPCFMRLGNNTVTSAITDHYMPAGTYHDISLGPVTKDRYIAVIRAEGTDGTLYISERE